MSGFFSGRSGGGLAGGLSGGVKVAAVALLVQQLMKHARQGGAGGPEAAAPSGGGLGGLLGGLLGGGMAGAGQPGGLLGGLGGLLEGLRRHGLGPQVESWVGRGENQTVSPQELERQFDPQELDSAAREAGTDRQSLLEELSRTLPQFVDRATPRGQVPQREEEVSAGSMGGLLSSLLGAGTAPPPRGG